MSVISAEYMIIDSKTYFGNTGSAKMSDAMNPINLYSCGRESLIARTPIGPFAAKYYLIIIGEEGKALYHINEEEIELGMNKMCLVSPGEEFWITIERNEPWHFMWLGFNGHQASSITERVGFARGHRAVDLCDVEEIADGISNILKSSSMTDACEWKRIGGMCEVLGLMMENSINDSVRNEAPKIKYVNKAVHIISEHYGEKIKITDIADMVGINRSYLSNLFKKELSMSPQEFLISYRLDKAAQMLNETEESVGNIAAAVGYADPLAFSKAFKQKFGISPRSYRNNQ